MLLNLHKDKEGRGRFVYAAHTRNRTDSKNRGAKNRLSVSDSREEAFRSYAHGRAGRKPENKTIGKLYFAKIQISHFSCTLSAQSGFGWGGTV